MILIERTSLTLQINIHSTIGCKEGRMLQLAGKNIVVIGGSRGVGVGSWKRNDTNSACGSGR